MSDHKGHRLLRKGAGPFGNDDDAWENVTWEEYDRRRELDRREREARDKIDTLPAETVISLVEGLA